MSARTATYAVVRRAAYADDGAAGDNVGEGGDDGAAGVVLHFVDEAGLRGVNDLTGGGGGRGGRSGSAGPRRDRLREVNKESVQRALAIRYSAVGVAVVLFIVVVAVLAVYLPDSSGGDYGDGASRPGALTSSSSSLSSSSLTSLSITTTSGQPVHGGAKFLHFSDFHLDLLYDAEFGVACFCNDPLAAAGVNASAPIASAATTAAAINTPLSSRPSGSIADNPNNASALELLAAKCRLAAAREAVLGRHGCDSPELLINRTLQHARAVLPDPAFILVTGDYVRHGTDRLLGGGPARVSLIVRTMARVDELVRAHFPTVNTHHALEPFYDPAATADDADDDEAGVLQLGQRNTSSNTTHNNSAAAATTPASTVPAGGGGPGGDDSVGDDNDGGAVALVNALGNNDLDGDYNLPVATGETESPWLARVAPAFFGSLETAQAASFRAGGYYSQEVVPGLHVLSLNTVIYSPHHRPSNVSLDDPFGQFAWLRATLATVRAEGGAAAAYIAGHIPPTIDQYSFSLQWEERFADRYFGVVAEFRDIVRGQLFGHVHCNTFRLLPLPAEVAKAEAADEVGGAAATAAARARAAPGVGPAVGAGRRRTAAAGVASSLPMPPVFVTTAITPVYQNNPGFRVWEFDDVGAAASAPAAADRVHGTLRNFTLYALSLFDNDDAAGAAGADSDAGTTAAGGGGRSSTVSGATAVIASSAEGGDLEEVAAGLLTNDTAWGAYVDQLWADDADEAVAAYKADAGFRVRSYCAIRYYSNASFSACVACVETAGAAGATGVAAGEC